MESKYFTNTLAGKGNFGGLHIPAKNPNSSDLDLRWQGDLDAEDWSKERIRVASNWIKSDRKVADLGCGTQVLADKIDESCAYTGYDVGKMNVENIHLDLNKKFELNEFYDVVVLLGVLEYLEDPLSTVRRLKMYCNEVIISYVSAKNLHSSNIKIREGIGVKNHLTKVALTDCLRESDLAIINNFTIWDNPNDEHLMYHLSWNTHTE